MLFGGLKKKMALIFGCPSKILLFLFRTANVPRGVGGNGRGLAYRYNELIVSFTVTVGVD